MNDTTSETDAATERPVVLRLLDYWRSLGWQPEAECTDGDLDAWEVEHRLKLPEDLRLFLKGFERAGCHWPDHDTLVAMWGLGAFGVVQESPVRADPALTYVAIGDHCFDACRYYIGLSAQPISQAPIVVYFGNPHVEETVALSFSEFASMFLTAPERLEFW